MKHERKSNKYTNEELKTIIQKIEVDKDGNAHEAYHNQFYQTGK